MALGNEVFSTSQESRTKFSDIFRTRSSRNTNLINKNDSPAHTSVTKVYLPLKILLFFKICGFSNRPTWLKISRAAYF